MSSLADKYETMYPGTGIPEAQKQERMERIQFKQEVASGRRPARRRSIIVPELKWKEEPCE